MARTFTALRRMTVDGGRQVDVGDEVPEAAGWKNLDVYIDNKWLAVSGAEDAPEPASPVEVPNQEPETAQTGTQDGSEDSVPTVEVPEDVFATVDTLKAFADQHADDGAVLLELLDMESQGKDRSTAIAHITELIDALTSDDESNDEEN